MRTGTAPNPICTIAGSEKGAAATATATATAEVGSDRVCVSATLASLTAISASALPLWLSAVSTLDKIYNILSDFKRSVLLLHVHLATQKLDPLINKLTAQYKASITPEAQKKAMALMFSSDATGSSCTC